MELPPPDASPVVRRLRVRIRGAVQGVGFRPLIRQLALEHGLSGWVMNDGDGVLLELEGLHPEDALSALQASPPPLAHIERLESEATQVQQSRDFEIRQSLSSAVHTQIIPDAAVCTECLDEMFTPSNRRYLYPFLNCTHCGPRYTITKRLPYDRANTSMRAFAMCAECSAEYGDPDDRRYHAQPTACPECGPVLSHSIDEIMQVISQGQIVALKGIGGFHLVCDARIETAVDRLRSRKQRDAKPFAVMVANLASAEAVASPSCADLELLSSRAAPIVLVPRGANRALTPSIAPGLIEIGLVLPYAPVHHLMFHHAAGSPTTSEWREQAHPLALVMTSANISGEPLVTDNSEARQRLGAIADLVVEHDRDILIRADDSVMRTIAGAPAFIRRARGFTPNPIQLPTAQPPTLAFGGHLKSTICVSRGDKAFVSQHIGDLDTPASVEFLRETVEHMVNLVEITPEIIACDAHPDFQSTQLAEEYATGLNAPLIRVQHHHAHIAAVAAEYRVTGPLLGLALDGYGYGDDAEAWGGELLLHDGPSFERLGYLRPLALPGGDRAARQPWRMAASALSSLGRACDIPQKFPHEPLAPAVMMMLKQDIAPKTSSCGRLFDAAAGLLGLSHTSRYEAEPAMLLESLVNAPRRRSDDWRIEADNTLDFGPVLNRIADFDIDDQSAQHKGANLFHDALVDGLAEWVCRAARKHGMTQVALSGGCMLNKVLAEGLMAALVARDLTPLYPRSAPPGDGAISLGQALVASQSMSQEVH